MTSEELVTQAVAIPRWELALQDEAASQNDFIQPFVHSTFARQLIDLDVAQSTDDLRDLVLRSKHRADERLRADSRYDELRARIAASLILWRIEDTPVPPEVWSTYSRIRKSARNDGRQDWRAFRQSLARCQYRHGPEGAKNFSDLQRDDDTKGASTKFRSDIRDALAAVLYTLVVGGEISDYWDRVGNVIVRPNYDEKSQIPRDFRDRMIERLDRAPEHYPAHLTTTQLSELLETEVFGAHSRQHSAQVLPPLRMTGTDMRRRALDTPSANIYVTGIPGSGKTTILRSATVNAVRHRNSSAGVFVSLPGLALSLDKESDLTTGEAVEVLLNEASRVFGHMVKTERDYLTEAILHDSTAVVCLDGLDEVPLGAQTDRTIRFIRSLRSAPCQIILSSRPSTRLRLDSRWTPIVTEELGRANARQVFELWFSSNEDGRRALALEALDLHLKGGSGTTPLLLGFVAYVTEFDQQYQSRGQLFEQYVALTLERIWKESNQLETDDVSIVSLRRAATGLAWRMATGQTSRTRRPNQWLNEATLDDLLREAPTADYAAIKRLASTEGLLGVAAVGASRLHTRYSWIHRSIHENLVGGYLAEQYRNSPKPAIETMKKKAGLSESWQLAISHMIDVLGPDDFQALIGVLFDIAYDKNGDESLTHAVEVVLGSLELDVEQLASLEREAIKRDLSGESFDDSSESRQKLLDDAQSGTSIDYSRIFALDGRVGFERAFIEELTRKLLQRADANIDLLLELAAVEEEETATASALAYLDLCQAGLLGYPRYAPRLSKEFDATNVVARVGEAAWPEPRWRMTRLLILWGVDIRSFASAGGPLDERDFLVHEAIGESPVSRENDVLKISAEMAKGDHGEVLAYLSARGPAVVVGTPSAKWAILGAWEQGLINDPLGLIRHLPEAKIADASPTIREFQPSWRSDPDRMIDLLMSLAVSVAEPRRVETAIIIEAYRRILCDPTWNELNFIESQVERSALLRVFTSVFTLRGLEEAVVSMIRTAPENWRATNGNIPLVDVFVRAEMPQSPDSPQWVIPNNTVVGFYAAAEWAARAGIPLLTSLHNPLEIQRADPLEVLGNFSIRVLSVPENMKWFDYRFSLFSKHMWPCIRRRVLAMAASMHTMDVFAPEFEKPLGDDVIGDLKAEAEACSDAPAPTGFWYAEKEDGCWYYSTYGANDGQVIIRFETVDEDIVKVVRGVIMPMPSSEKNNFAQAVRAYFQDISEEIYFDAV